LPSVEEEEETRQRGGCMLLFRERFSSLACPQFVPELPRRGGEKAPILSRRSDSLWLAEQARRGVRCVVLPGLFVMHENTHDSIPSPARARANALAEAFGSALCRDAPVRVKYLQDRVWAMIANNERIRGLPPRLITQVYTHIH